ncbi:MAG: hypothetical protein ACRCUJ_06475 [Phocaeicola sp.]
MRALFSDDDLERWFNRFMDRSNEKLFKVLSAAGEKFVEVARKSRSYGDQTGNLRSSIGYIIVNDGKILSDNFEQVKSGNEGIKEARQLASEVASTHKNGMALICVAGMNYAAAVEAKGKDVVTSGTIQCEKYLRDTLKKLFSKM